MIKTKQTILSVAQEFEAIAPGWGFMFCTAEGARLAEVSKASRGERYRQVADVLRMALEEFEKHQSAAALAGLAFSHEQVCAGLFRSPISKRLRGCEDYLAAARQAWVMSEIPNLFRRDWDRLFQTHGGDVGKAWMSRADRRRITSLPKVVTVWRGYNAPFARLGFSWSLSRQVAASFPFKRQRGGSRPTLLKGTVPRSKIIAYIGSRREQEVIAFPEDVKVISSESIGGKFDSAFKL